ncbi:MAG: hypothetical protein JST32_13575, partial [Bacteroidetes bacterium]|nr:hypothetical protein [Bacteroidota bacterium]
SAFLDGQRRTKKELTRFLLTRGAWLIVSDLLIISFLFSFDLQYHLLVLEVLWAIGFGMIILALLIHTPRTVIAAIALLILFGHNLLDYLPPAGNGPGGTLRTIFLSAAGSVLPLGAGRSVAELYSVLPWACLLLLGYVFGPLYKTGADAAKRQKILVICGCAFIGLFIVLRYINHYGDPAPWSVQRNAAHTLLSFLNTTKQVPSLLFVAMTLGPVMVLLAWAEKFNNRLTAFFEVYGNVPYFYFIGHLCLLRIINVLLIALKGLPFKSDGNPFVWQAVGFGFPLWAVYLFWAFIVAAMYFPAKWYGTYKRSHQKWWLSYV